MATIFRGPLYSKHHRRPDPPSSFTTGPNLLTTTLFVAAAVLPFNNASAFPAQVQHPSHQLTLNADTSRGVPKTLTLDAVSPSFDAPGFAPQHPRRAGQLNADTSLSTPKVLYADAVRPAFNGPSSAPDKIRTSNADTSRGMFPGLSSTVAAPFIPAPTALAPIWRSALNADTSSEIPKTLYQDDVVAVFDGPHFAPQHKGIRYLNADTTADSPIALLLAVAPAPFTQTPPFAAVRSKWQPADTSAGSSQNLLTPVVAGVPFVPNPTALAPVWRRALGADGSHGMPKTLYADSVKPFFNPPHTPPDRLRPVYDTSHGVSPLVLTFIPPKPFSQNDWPAPVEYRFKQQRTWDVQEYIERIPYRPIVNNTTVAYFPARMWGAGESVGVAPTTNQANLKTWLPHISVPVAEADGRMNVQWWRFFNYLANTKVGGPEAPTIPDIATSVATAQTQAADASTTASAVQQVVVNNAEALSATREVLQDNDVPGSEQIPRVKRFLLDE